MHTRNAGDGPVSCHMALYCEFMKHLWTRRRLLQSATLIPAALAFGVDAQDGPSSEIEMPLGRVRGFTPAAGIRVFRGVPFAEPPVGPLRFHRAVPVRPWNGVRDATQFKAAALQPNRSDISEDCLYLNVFAPAGSGPYPVFVWIHGGGYTGGSPSDAIFDGTSFAQQGIIVVTVAYRLGVFGFLDWSPMLGPEYADSANNALRDLITALHWVQTNISSFGGDASRVTIGGESAGAKLTGTLMGIEEARPLFQQMISESGGAERIRSGANSAEVTQTFAAPLKRLAGQQANPREAAGNVLLSAQQALIDVWDGNFPLRAESGGALLPDRAIPVITGGSTRGKRLLIGTNRDESALFLGDHPAAPLTQRNLGNTSLAKVEPVLAKYKQLYPEMTPAQLNIRALTAEEYWVPSMRVAAAHVSGGGTAWSYRLDEEAVSGRFAGEAYHSFDLGFVWKRLAKSEPAALQHLAVQMHDAWAAFINGRAPTADGLPAWPQWNAKTRPTMLLNSTSRVEEKPFEAELRLWDGFTFD